MITENEVTVAENVTEKKVNKENLKLKSWF